MSQQKTYEGATIEEALNAVSEDLGDDVEIVEAVKQRKGGLLGFFAKETFEVTAKRSETAEDSDSAFGSILLEMADGIDDTVEMQGTVPASPAAHVAASPAAGVEPAATATPTMTPSNTAGVIDLRSGTRRPTTVLAQGAELTSSQKAMVVDPAPMLEATEIEPAPTQHAVPTVTEIDATAATTYEAPRPWSLRSLRALELPLAILESVAELSPKSDIEWLHALSISIDVLLTEAKANPSGHVEGHGRGAAVELVQGLPAGRVPVSLIVDGLTYEATADELAFALREAIR